MVKQTITAGDIVPKRKIIKRKSTVKKKEENISKINVKTAIQLQEDAEKNTVQTSKVTKLKKNKKCLPQIAKTFIKNGGTTKLNSKSKQKKNKSVIKVKVLKTPKRTNPLNLAVTEHIQEPDKSPLKLVQKTKKTNKKEVGRSKSKLNNTKLPATIVKTENLDNGEFTEGNTHISKEISPGCKQQCVNLNNSPNAVFEIGQNNSQEAGVEVTNSDVHTIANLTEIKVEEPDLMEVNVATESKQIQNMAKMDSNIDKNNKGTKSEAPTKASNVQDIIKSHTAENKFTQFAHWRRIIKSKHGDIVRKKKSKLHDNISGNKKKSSGIRNTISSSSGESSDENVIPTSTSNFSDNKVHRSEESSHGYLKVKHFKELGLAPSIDHVDQKVTDESAEYTQDEDADERVVKKRKKVSRKSKKLTKNTVEETTLEKGNRLDESGSCGYESRMITSNIHIVHEVDSNLEQRMHLSTVNQSITKLPDASSKEKSGSIVSLNNTDIIEDTEESEIKRNRLLKYGESIDYVVKKYSCEKNTVRKHKKGNDNLQNIMKSINSKIPRVDLRNILLDKNYVEKYKLHKVLEKSKPTKKHKPAKKIDYLKVNSSFSDFGTSSSTNVNHFKSKSATAINNNMPSPDLHSLKPKTVSPKKNNPTASSLKTKTVPSNKHTASTSVDILEAKTTSPIKNTPSKSIDPVETKTTPANNMPSINIHPSNKIALSSNNMPSNSTDPLKTKTSLQNNNMREFCGKNNNSNSVDTNKGRVATNFRITVSVSTDDAFITRIPIANQDTAINESYTNFEEPDYENFEDPEYENFEEPEYENFGEPEYENADAALYDSESPSNNDMENDPVDIEPSKWNSVHFYPDNITTVKSYNNIFENAEFSFKWDRDVAPDDRNLKSQLVIKKQNFPTIVCRTIDNNYANKKMDSPAQSSIEKNAGNGRVRTSVDSEDHHSDSIPPPVSSLTTENLAKHAETLSDERETNSAKSSEGFISKNLLFKIPVLPPAKRPPAVNTCDRPFGEVEDENDDAISLAASSIHFNDEMSEVDMLDDLDLDVPEEENEILKEPDIPDSSVNVNPSSPLHDSPAQSLTTSNSSTLENNISTWLATASNNDFSTDQLQDQQLLGPPIVFKQLCYFKYFRQACFRRQLCRKLHYVKGVDIINLPYDELNTAYLYAKTSCKLYRESLDFFIIAFEKFKSAPELMQFVNDVLHSDIYNKTPFVEKLISSLCTVGIPFIDAVEDIFICGERSDVLSDILLEIVCISHKQHIYNNWCIVKKLIKHRTKPIDSGIAQDIMKLCYHNQNIKLAVNIVQDLVEPKLVDIQAINAYELNIFLSLIKSPIFKEGQILRDQMKQYNIFIMPQILVEMESRLDSDTDPKTIKTNKSQSGSVSDHNDLRTMSDTAENRTNEIENTESQSINVPPEHADLALMSENVPAIANDSVSCNSITEHHANEAPGSQPLDNFSELDFDENYDSLSSRSDDYNQNINNKSLANTENSNDVMQLDSIPRVDSPTFSNISSSGSIIEDIHSDISSDCSDILTQETAPYGSVCSVGSSTTSQYLNELEYPGNLTPTNSMNDIPIHTLKNHERLEKGGLLQLKHVIMRGNNMEFFVMLRKFKDTNQSRAFILNTLVFFKEIPPQAIFDLMFPLITNVERLGSNLKDDHSLMNMLNMLTVNILGFLENHKAYNLASDILLHFRGKYDELCDASWFARPHRYVYSEIGKYIYICKVLVKGQHLKEAWEIFTNPELKLLHGVGKWTHKHCDFFDNKLRNYVLDDLIKTALVIDIPFAKDVLLSIINDNDIITEINVWMFYNQLLLNMLDRNIYKTDLINMVDNILHGWYKNLHISVLRGLFVELALDLSEPVGQQLYDKCCMRKCYPYIKGDEKILYFTTDMVDVEIYMTLHVYMYKKVRNDFPLHTIKLMMRLPEVAYQQPWIRSNSDDSIRNLKLKIINVLAGGLHFTVCVDYNNTEHQWIVVQAKQLHNLFNYYRKIIQLPNP